jgi:biopolymer transport protein ExbD
MTKALGRKGRWAVAAAGVAMVTLVASKKWSDIGVHTAQMPQADIVVSIDSHGRTFLGDREIPRTDLVAALEREMRGTGRETVVVRGHTSVKLGEVIDNLKAVRLAKARLLLQ